MGSDHKKHKKDKKKKRRHNSGSDREEEPNAPKPAPRIEDPQSNKGRVFWLFHLINRFY